jgi:hypothetical protein
VDTAQHFCPNANCAYRGWVGWGNLQANGPPSGGPWRQLHCTVCKGYFQETHGTLLHGKRVAPDLLVWAVGALAAGWGIRAVARVFEVDPNTVLQWLVEAADHLTAFSQYFLHDVRVTQVQLDELYALLRAVKDGEVSEAEALKRLARSPHWVWVAIDPVTKLLLAIAVGDRTLAMAQCVVHQVVQVLAPGCVPLFLTDGFKEYTTALLAHDGQWVQPPRRQDKGPAPQAALAAAAAAMLCAGDQDRAPPAFGGRDASRGVRDSGGGQAGAGAVRLADQYRLRRADQPHHPPACGSSGTTGQHPMQGRGRLAAAARLVPCL